MASDEVPPSNLGDEVTDTEHEYEEDAEGEEGQEEQGEWRGAPGKAPTSPNQILIGSAEPGESPRAW